MAKFYTKAIGAGVLLITLSCALIYFMLAYSRFNHPLLPASASVYPRIVVSGTDQQEGGTSTVVLEDDTYILDFDMFLAGDMAFPYVAVGFIFDDGTGLTEPLNWSKYSYLQLSVLCHPQNVLTLALYTFDDEVTKVGDFSTYRASTTFFSCSEQWSDVTVDLSRLDTPEWWLQRFGVELSKQQYRLDKVAGVSFLNSPQSPVRVESSVKIGAAILKGRDWHYMYYVGIALSLVWGAYIVWCFRQHAAEVVADLRDKINHDRPLIAYQQISLKPRADKDRIAVLQYMATEYNNPDLNLEQATVSLGITQAKINEILKGDIGLTFNVYLNKLRLTEASRLLTESNVSVAEIAYAVGYNNVSYFNRLFKKEYGCTPKSFRKHMGDKNVEEDC